MTRALILAAGQGTRLQPLTYDKPKCLVTLLGKSLLARQVETLSKCGIQNVHIAGGFMINEIRAAGYECSENKDYANTNMVASLFSARSFMDETEDLMIGYGDIVYQTNNLQAMLDSDADISVMIDMNWLRYWQLRFDNPLSDAETLILDDTGKIVTLGSKTQHYEHIQGQYTGLIKVRGNKINEFINFYSTQDFSNKYMTYFLQALIDAGWEVKAVPVHNGWLEVDSIHDLELYEKLHAAHQLSSYYIPDV